VTDLRSAPVDLGTLRALMVSGSPLEPGRARAAARVLGPVVFHGYGQTETGMISMATPTDPSGSLGVPPVDLEVRDASGLPVPAGAEGEIFVRTPSQGSGYWGRPGLSDEVFVDGWVRTRDLGSLDAQGRLWLSGRTRDVVIVDANVYYTGPVERLLARHPAVTEAYVVAEPDDATGEAVHAFVVPAADRVPAPRGEQRDQPPPQQGEVGVQPRVGEEQRYEDRPHRPQCADRVVEPRRAGEDDAETERPEHRVQPDHVGVPGDQEQHADQGEQQLVGARALGEQRRTVAQPHTHGQHREQDPGRGVVRNAVTASATPEVSR
jgi:long-subunit acyl-CoA synthetase (AMP-forming)